MTVTYTVFMLQLVLPTSSAAPMFLPVGISSCDLVRQLFCGDFLLCISSQPEVCKFKVVPIVLLLSTNLGIVLFGELFLKTNDVLL